MQTLTQKAFEELFREHFTPLCAFARKYVNDVETAKEIVHDVFINLWNKRETIDLERKVKSYLFTSVHNRCLNYIRDNKKFDQNITELDSIDVEEQVDSSEIMMENELEKKIHAVIDTIPEKCREIFLLNRFDGLKYTEIAEKLDISIKTVETQMSKALKILREQLKDYIKILIIGLLLFI